jgi:glycosyltransferase involved in cell wall biosynthesis
MALARVLVEVDADALLCGDGPDREALERQIKALGMTDRIRMLGYRDDVASLMRRATALVFVSLVEGQPNSVLEAMATGCPLIVSDIPQHRGFLSDESAMFVDPQSPSSIADGVRRLLNDLPAAHQRAIRAYDIAVHQNVNHIATRYTEVYIAAGRRASIEVGR